MHNLNIYKFIDKKYKDDINLYEIIKPFNMSRDRAKILLKAEEIKRLDRIAESLEKIANKGILED